MNNTSIPFQNYRVESEHEDVDQISTYTDKIDICGNFTSDDEGISLLENKLDNKNNVFIYKDDDKGSSSKYGDQSGSEGEPCRGKASQDNMDRRRFYN